MDNLIPIQLCYTIFDDIKKMNNIIEYTTLSKKYLSMVELSHFTSEKKKIIYNLYYFAYLNFNLIKDKDKYIQSMIDKCFELIRDNEMYELICFILYFTPFENLKPEEKEKYKYALKKYKELNKPKDNDFKFKEYEVFEYLSYDIEKFLIDVDYFPTNERIKEIFYLFVKYENIIKKDSILKDIFSKVYNKTRNDLIRYCYLSI
jgi:hypothetical protein